MSYCIKCKASTENINPELKEAKNGKKYESSTCSICSTKKTRFLTKQPTEENKEPVKVIIEQNVTVKKKKNKDQQPTPTPQPTPIEQDIKKRGRPKKIIEEPKIVIVP